MPARRHRLALPFVLVALAATGVAGVALANGSEGRGGVTAAVAPPRSAAPPPALLQRAFDRCPGLPSRRGRSAAAAPRPALLATFGVLRRERSARDTLPAAALRALRDRGLAPAGAESARLLRTTPTGGRAWIVPVADVSPALAPFGFVRCAPPRQRKRIGRPGARRPAPARPAPRAPRPVPAPARPAPRVPRPLPPPATMLGPVPFAPRDVPGPARPGVAVVALGGAPAGGGGALDDLVRGRAPADVDVCAGARRDMLSVSGVVPDGVEAAYLTSQDGTAVRADVRENAYAFLVRRPRTPVARFVVWDDRAGVPHVQPLPLIHAGPHPCGALPPQLRRLQIPRVTPGFGETCDVAVLPRPRPRGRRGRPPRPGRAPLLRCHVGPMALMPIPAPPLRAHPAPSPARPAPPPGVLPAPPRAIPAPPPALPAPAPPPRRHP